MENGRHHIVVAVCVSVLAASSGSARADDVRPQARADASVKAPLLLERPDDPYMPGPEGGGIAGVSGTAAFGISVSVQVNVDDLGNNVFGDAANEPSIAVDPTAPNRMAIGWRQFDTIASNFRQAGYSYSLDGGRTWAGMDVIEPGLFRSDPVLGAGTDGTFYYMSLRVQGGDYWCDMFISDDAGATWPVKAYAYGGDKSWFAIDKTGGVGHGNIYQAWNIAGNPFYPNQFNRATDGGLTWEDPVEYDPEGHVARPCFGLLDVGPDGAVYVAGAQNSSNTDVFWVVRSKDAQNPLVTPTFDQITPIDMGGNLRIGTGPNPAGLLGQVNIAVDHSGGPTHGNVYVLCSVDPPGTDPMDVNLIRSTDDGETFSSPVRVNDDPAGPGNWQWFGEMSVAPNGRIDVIWNDTRGSGTENICQLYYSFSTDGGETWSVNVPLSGSFDSHVGWPNQNKLGDYYDIISDKVGAYLAWAATFNFEQDVYFLRIGDYDCNDNGVPDSQDIADETSDDCNLNGIPDECEIAAGTATDANGNGVPDECEECPWDCGGDFDGAIGMVDLLVLLGQWGEVGVLCDFDGNGVDIEDFLELLGRWGPCP
jgi:hypothetical protein